MGAKRGMVVGSACYIVFQLSLIYLITPVVLIGSIAVGCGGCLLWCSHGCFMSQISTDENKTRYYGIMQGIFSTAIIPASEPPPLHPNQPDYISCWYTF